MSAAAVFIYCDDPSHSARIAVRTFERNAGGEWQELLTAHDRKARRESVTSLVGDTPTAQLGGISMPRSGSLNFGAGQQFSATTDLTDAQHAATRLHYTLTCRKCPRRPIPARSENLDAVLDKIADTGVSEVSMSVLRASLELLGE